MSVKRTTCWTCDEPLSDWERAAGKEQCEDCFLEAEAQAAADDAASAPKTADQTVNWDERMAESRRVYGLWHAMLNEHVVAMPSWLYGELYDTAECHESACLLAVLPQLEKTLAQHRWSRADSQLTRHCAACWEAHRC